MEKIFFETGALKVTSTRFINGSTTYPINGVTSISSGEKEQSYANAGWAGFIGILFFIGGVVTPFSLGSTIFGILLLGAAFLIVKSIKPEYVITFGTAGGDKDGLVTKDKVFRDAVLKALNDAVSHRE